MGSLRREADHHPSVLDAHLEGGLIVAKSRVGQVASGAELERVLVAGAHHGALLLVQPAAGEQATGVVAGVVHGGDPLLVAREQHPPLPHLEARDAGAILALTTPDYTDAGDPARGISPTDHQRLEQRLKGDLSKVTGLRLEATVKDMEVRGEQARLDYFQVLRYAVATPSGEKWKSESDDARMRFVRLNGEWKIASGL